MDPVSEPHEPDPIVDAPPLGRVFAIQRRPLLADCAPAGRVRLDALARWMQDVAYADVEDAGVERAGFWVLRRTRINVKRFPRFAEHCQVSTFCSGLGRMWAERRTTVTASEAGSEPLVEAVALWVHLDPVRKLPSPLTEPELAIYQRSAGDRRVLARLRHPRPENVDDEWGWSFRRTDADVADHVNNAAYWEPLEEELLGQDGDLIGVDAEIEFRAPAQPGPKLVRASGPRRWITDPDGEEVYASTVLMNARTTPGSN